MGKLTIVRAYLAASRPNRFRSRQALEAYQSRKLERHLARLHSTSPYLQALPAIKDIYNLHRLPLMDKPLMMEHFDEMNTVGLKSDEALELAIQSERSRDFTMKYQGLTVGLSSGTSGHRGLFVVSDRERELWAGTIVARFLPPRQLVRQRIAFFLRADNNLYETIGSKLLKFKYFDIYKDLEANIAALDIYQPTILVAPPSMLTIIAERLEASSLDIHPQKVISVAEVLEPSDEKRLKQAFRTNIIHQIYQCTEGFLGYTCHQGMVHPNEDIAIFEKESVGEGRFVPIVTDFRRLSQPIIRYRLNDILLESDTACPCGSIMTAIARIEGREGDMLLFKNTQGTTIRVFSDMVGRCMLYASGFTEYRVVQTSFDRLDIYLDQLSKHSKRSIKAEFDGLATKLDFQPPRITYKKYKRDLTKKLRRIERVF